MAGHLGLIVVLALATRGAVAQLPGDPARIAEATEELTALGDEFRLLQGRLPTTDGFEVRLYTFVSGGNMTALNHGRFSRLITEKAAPAERARYFLDPWNYPYWIADQYDGGRRRLILYSLGPDRRADLSAGAEIGDDIIEVAYEGPARSQ